ncbi:flagellar hook protein FlgE [Campylobacter fetus subsp. testudinum]|uniref:flagellar hook protein FlgE n=2 Tax=Campylobacter fetus TaxID=196 RepID=UPI0003C28B24|nr:flagellar hook protein FlgE [Campylobacter fetus]AGZ82545.1 flagellar hook protein, epsilonproteobacterial variant [Campylobacter fetus subsp. testudinum 03-427]EAI4322429.1 flagellar hook protein FlgE [Campylobacter fetus]EAI4391241.1 flagellar hook protein FlgE [Campylobacter fetus]OCS06672.1 flagellar hook protein FlgE [Campylobacter fetus subsp. testudinum]OCS08611.1 flagellar hook protein FlgE [Campylobacter fetus subsp. testudinum]
MMRALWAGVTGLQAHQIAMDVEGDNIANVNTVGFKYSRASFADLFSQTAKVATAPQGDLGGKNSMQIGLGTQINSVTKIFKQGSVQTTDKNTDLAIQGDGFFVVSPDGGKTYKYTRNGDFSRDSLGNFVDKNGYIVQGWLRNEDTGTIDPTGPVKNIQIEPGLSTPARATTEVALIGNLNSGSSIGTKSSPIYSLDSKNGWLDKNGNGLWEDGETKNENDLSKNEYYVDKDKQVKVKETGVDLGVLFNATGDAFNLREGQGMWVSYADAKTTFAGGLAAVPPAGGHKLNIAINGIEIPSTSVTTVEDIVNKINTITDKTGVTASLINGNQIQLVNQNNLGNTDTMKNIKITKLGGDTTSIASTNVITAYKYTYTATATGGNHSYNDSSARKVHTTEDLRKAMQTDAREYVNYQGENVSQAATNAQLVAAAAVGADRTAMLNAATAEKTRLDAIVPVSQGAIAATAAVIAAINATPTTATAAEVTAAINAAISNDKLAEYSALDWGAAIDTDAAAGIQLPADDPDGKYSNASLKDRNRNDGVEITVNEKGQFVVKNPQGDAAYGENDSHLAVDATGALVTDGSASDSPLATTNPDGTVNIPVNNDTFTNDYNMHLAITGLSDPNTNINENTKFTDVFSSLGGGLSTGTGEKTSSNIVMSSHAATTEIYDSLGSKHEIKMEFRKISYSPENGTEWSMLIQVPEPGKINTETGEVSNVIAGTVRFKSDGSLLGYSPSNLTFTANNGSAPGQNIEINFGKIGDYNGLRSNDNTSTTDNIVQDGYTAGTLNELRVDESGTIIGAFTNGRSFGLAQVALAKFTNNEGLESDGGNVFVQTANSGDPVIGAAQTAGRGKINASSLEMSNVDLSRSLTQLIVVQRGYQANSKTITTGDQMLNTLLQLKQ